jgi:NitT/TauT family transport system ATP-binding protein
MGRRRTADELGGTTLAAVSPNGRSSTTPRIRIREVERTFLAGRRAVDALGPLDLDVADGEFLCVVGPSGCGKSTLLRVIAGLIRPSAGRVEIVRSGTGDTLLAMVFQDHGIYPWKTVEENVRFGLDINRSVPRAERRERVHAQLAMLGLSDVAGAFPATLSGGMRQRVSIARALAVEPELLLMDEPFASLDAQLRTILQDELVALWERDRRTVVFITHNIDEAIYLGDRIVVMSARPGRVCATYDVPFDRPRGPELRRTPEFAALEQDIWEVLRGEVDGQLGRGDGPGEKGGNDAAHG